MHHIHDDDLGRRFCNDTAKQSDIAVVDLQDTSADAGLSTLVLEAVDFDAVTSIALSYLTT